MTDWSLDGSSTAITVPEGPTMRDAITEKKPSFAPSSMKVPLGRRYFASTALIPDS
jgi:hypothetical protein